MIDCKPATGLVRRPLLALRIIWPMLVCCAGAGTPPGSCCAAGILDSSKLLQANRSGISPSIMTLTLDYYPGQRFDLATLLRQPPQTKIVWMENGTRLNGSMLAFRSAPKADSVIVYSIEASREGRSASDGFQLVSLPRETRERFEAWINKERFDTAWISLLPPAYGSLGPGFSNPEPANCGQLHWDGVHKLDTNFHPGGAYEMRSRAVGDGSGHQAVYDSAGKLIREGLGAGSADRATPRFWAFGYLRHRDQDVRPFVWAAQLDGNPVTPTWLFFNLNAPLIRLGEHIKAYQSVRPALANHPSEIPAGSCISNRK